jgi:hypothetical protein
MLCRVFSIGLPYFQVKLGNRHSSGKNEGTCCEKKDLVCFTGVFYPVGSYVPDGRCFLAIQSAGGSGGTGNFHRFRSGNFDIRQSV